MTFIFIDSDDTGFTALDATEITSLEVSGIFIEDTKEVMFRLGNTGSGVTHFDISASGVNATIVDDVEFSTDNGSVWATTATISGVEPNAITDIIKCRYTPDEGEILGVGSFLIRVDE